MKDYFRKPETPMLPIQLLPGTLAFALLLWLLVIAPWRQSAAMRKINQGILEASVITVTEEQVHTCGSTSRSVVRWDHFDGYRLAEDVLLAYFKSGSEAQLFLKSFFTEHDWHRLVQLVQRKLPAR